MRRVQRADRAAGLRPGRRQRDHHCRRSALVHRQWRTPRALRARFAQPRRRPEPHRARRRDSHPPATAPAGRCVRGLADCQRAAAYLELPGLVTAITFPRLTPTMITARWAVMLLVAISISAPIRAHAAPVPSTSCAVFPTDNIWNTDISTMPVNAKSAQWLTSTSAATTRLHPDFGGPPYGFPFNVVTNAHPLVTVTFQYASENDPGP